MKRDEMIRILDNAKAISVAVIGDFALDRYFIIDTNLNEPSLETGLIAYQVVETTKSPGASGSVARNLSSIGAGSVYAVGIGGLDGGGYDLKEELDRFSINDDYLVRSNAVVTPQYIKTVHLSKGSRAESNRLDIKNFRPTPSEIEQKVYDNLSDIFDKCHAIVILDQMAESNCGVITEKIRKRLVELAKSHTNKVVVTDSRTRIADFDGVIVKCNHLEACKAYYPFLDEEPTEEMIMECGAKLYKKNNKPAYITLGKGGILSFSEDGTNRIPTVHVPPPIDIVGAGDSVTAAITMALSAGASHSDAALLGNIVASITIRQIGTTGAATPEQIMEAYDKYFA